MTQLTTRCNDTHYATALHEAAHATTYLSLNLTFAYTSAHEAYTKGSDQPIDAWSHAVICMAGPAIEAIMMHPSAEPQQQLSWALQQLANDQALKEEDPSLFENDSDFEQAGIYARAALPVAFAIVQANLEHVETVAAAMLKTDPLQYADVTALIPETIPIAPTMLDYFHM